MCHNTAKLIRFILRLSPDSSCHCHPDRNGRLFLRAVVWRAGHRADSSLCSPFSVVNRSSLSCYNTPLPLLPCYTALFSMRILDRYVVREVARHALLGLLIFTFVLFVPKLVRLMELFVRHSGSGSQIAQLFLCILPSVLVFTIPK